MQAVNQIINGGKITFQAIFNFACNVGLVIMTIINVIIKICQNYFPKIYKFMINLLKNLNNNNDSEKKPPIIDNSWCNIDVKNIIYNPNKASIKSPQKEKPEINNVIVENIVNDNVVVENVVNDNVVVENVVNEVENVVNEVENVVNEVKNVVVENVVNEVKNVVVNENVEEIIDDDIPPPMTLINEKQNDYVIVSDNFVKNEYNIEDKKNQ